MKTRTRAHLRAATSADDLSATGRGYSAQSAGRAGRALAGRCSASVAAVHVQRLLRPTDHCWRRGRPARMGIGRRAVGCRRDGSRSRSYECAVRSRSAADLVGSPQPAPCPFRLARIGGMGDRRLVLRRGPRRDRQRASDCPHRRTRRRHPLRRARHDRLASWSHSEEDRRRHGQSLTTRRRDMAPALAGRGTSANVARGAQRRSPGGRRARQCWNEPGWLARGHRSRHCIGTGQRRSGWRGGVRVPVCSHRNRRHMAEVRGSTGGRGRWRRRRASDLGLRRELGDDHERGGHRPEFGATARDLRLRAVRSRHSGSAGAHALEPCRAADTARAA